MPTNVKLFLGLYGVAMVMSLAGFVGMLTLIAPFNMSLSERAAIVTIPAVELVAGVVLTVLAGFWRQNWARWALMVLFVLGLALTSRSTMALRHLALVPAILLFVEIALQAVGLVFAFSAGARPWFEPGTVAPEKLF
jgi:hypothetical protein